MFYPIAMYPLSRVSGEKLAGFRVFIAPTLESSVAITKYRVGYGVGTYNQGVYINKALNLDALRVILGSVRNCFCIDLRTQKAEELAVEVWRLDLRAYPVLKLEDTFGVPCKCVYNYDKISVFYDYFKQLYPSVMVSPRNVSSSSKALCADMCAKHAVYLSMGASPIAWVDEQAFKGVLNINFVETMPMCYSFEYRKNLMVLYEGMKRHQKVEVGCTVLLDLKEGVVLLNRSAVEGHELIRRNMRFDTAVGIWRPSSGTSMVTFRAPVLGYKEV